MFTLLAYCLRLIAAITPTKWASHFGAAMVKSIMTYKKRDRVRAQKHLAYAFPEKSTEWIRHTARRNFRMIGRMAASTLTLVNKDEEWFNKHITLHPSCRQHLYDLMRSIHQKEGTVLAASHFGIGK